MIGGGGEGNLENINKLGGFSPGKKSDISLLWAEYAKFIWALPDILSGEPPAPVLRQTFWILAGYFIVKCPANINLFTGLLFAVHCQWFILTGHFVQKDQKTLTGNVQQVWWIPCTLAVGAGGLLGPSGVETVLVNLREEKKQKEAGGKKISLKSSSP